MKTATKTTKVNRWLHEHLAKRTPVKLLGGLALGALVITATALPLGTTYADEPARPLSSEQGACYPLYPELGPCWASEFVAVTPTSADRNDRGLFDEVLPEDLKPIKAVSPVVSEQIQCYFEMDAGCPRDSFLAEVLPDPALATDATILGVQFEYWPEVGFDSYTYHRFMVEQGKVDRALSGGSDTEVFAPGDDLSHFLSSIDMNEVWTEIEDTPVHHLMKQLKAGS